MTEVSFAKSFLTTLDNKTTKYQPDHIFDPATFGTRIPFTLPKLPTPQHPPPPKQQDGISTGQTVPGAEPATSTTNTINLTFKSSRNPTMTLTFSSTPPGTTIASFKKQIQDYLGGPSVVPSVDKIKILFNKKPVPASKETVGEIVDKETKDLELGVMVIGGAPDPPPQDTSNTAVKARVPEPAGPGSENAAVEAETGHNPAEDTTTIAMEGVQQTSSKPRTDSQSLPVQPGEESGAAVLQSQEFWSDLEGFLSQRIRSQEEAERLRAVFERAWRSNNAGP